MSAASTTHTTPTSAGSAGSDFAQALRSKLEAAASWEDRTYSIKVVVGFNTCLLVMRMVNLHPFAALMSCCALLVVAGFPVSRFTTFAESMKNQDPKTEIISKANFMQTAESAYTSINLLAHKCADLFCWADMKSSVAVVACLFAAGWLFSRLSLTMIIFIAFNAFLMFKPSVELYNKYAAQHCSPLLNQVRGFAGEMLKMIPSLDDSLLKSKKI